MNFDEAYLNEIFEDLYKLETSFLKEASIFLQPNTNTYLLDFYYSAIINRSISLISGFITLSKENNYVSSVPLIRIQIDNCLRFYATTLVNDCDAFFMDFMKGKHVGNIQDGNGKKMHDTYLVEKLDIHFPGIHKLYKNTSGYVHLSNKHAFLQTKIMEERTIGIRIGNFDFYNIDKKVDFAYNMFKASEILLDLVKQWNLHRMNGLKN